MSSKDDQFAEKSVMENSDEKNLSKSPDTQLLKNMRDLGITKTLSEKALTSTGNKSLEAALDWIADLGPEDMAALCANDQDSDEGSDSDDSEEDFFYKMIFVVNAKLGMGVGKVASQVGHAAVGLYKELREDTDKFGVSLQEWDICGEKKITLRGKDADHLLELQKLAESNDLPTYIVQDAGHTQIANGSITVLAIFGDEEAIDFITGTLKLL